VYAPLSVQTAEIRNGRHPLQRPLLLSVQVLQNNVARVSIREKPGALHARWEPRDVLMDDAVRPATAGVTAVRAEDGTVTVRWDSGDGDGGPFELVVAPKPFVVTLSVAGAPAIALNSLGKLTFEQYRNRFPKPIPPPPADSIEALNAAPPAVHEPEPHTVPDRPSSPMPSAMCRSGGGADPFLLIKCAVRCADGVPLRCGWYVGRDVRFAY
jgi:hypothetical protein